MSRIQIIWTSIALFVVVLFYAGIPVATYDAHTVLTSFIGAILFGSCVFMVIGDFRSVDDIRSLASENTKGARRFSPIAIIPALIFLVVLVVHQGDRKNQEIIEHGKFAKGIVVGGGSTTTKRNFSSSTSYSLTVEYKDSANIGHVLKESVDWSDYSKMYQGATVDVQYSKRHPSLARLVVSREELAEHMDIPTDTLNVTHLLSILENKIPKDSILTFLNSINYEWAIEREDIYYNSKLNLAVKVFPGAKQIVYLQQTKSFGMNQNPFETNLAKYGFKKKSTTSNNETTEVYYNDQYVISKEREVSSRNNANEFGLSTVSLIYYIAARE